MKGYHMNTKNQENSHIDAIRHSLSHVLAMAILKKFPKAELGIGPTIENGFYYDFKLPHPLADKDLPEIEEAMRAIIKMSLDVTGEETTPANAKKIFKGQPFKLDLIKEFSKEKKPLTLYYTGKEFFDLCRGGHVTNTKEIDPTAFALTHVAGAYWRGNEKNPQLTRIYGLAFETKEELAEYIRREEEAKKRDHRKLAKELELFAIVDEVGPGLPLFYPKGMLLRRLIEDYVERLQESKGYKAIWIPHITKGELYKISGHLDKYDAMYPPMKLKGEADYYLKPMNCPHFMMLYKTIPHSYKELPIRWTSTTTNYRYEKSGELSGLTRVRALTQDDCHVFARPDQIESEIHLMLDMVALLYKKFGFTEFWVRVSTHDPKNKEKYIGDPKIWEESEQALTRMIEKRGWKYEIGVGEAAFYGPKLDFIFKDVIGREWQLSTIQLDMNLPERFKIEYIDSDGSKKRPVLIHRALLGSTERFLGILIEHFAGAFPFWLAPTQIQILTVNDSVSDYAHSVKRAFEEKEIRVSLDERNETIGKKIREAELQKIPYLLIIGPKEKEAGTVAVRKRSEGDKGQMPLQTFLNTLSEK